MAGLSLPLASLLSTNHVLQRAYHVSTCVLLPSLPLGVVSDDDDDTPEERKVMRDITWAGINHDATRLFCKNRTHLRSIWLNTGMIHYVPFLMVQPLTPNVAIHRENGVMPIVKCI